jgi:hypothetical protein
MSIVPRKDDQLLAWTTLRSNLWLADPGSIGLTTGQVTAYRNTVITAQENFNTRAAAAAAAKAATTANRESLQQLRRSTAELLNFIKAYALSQPNPGAVYAAAQIPPPGQPSPVPPPGTPFDFRVELLQSGAITLRWKCANPAGGTGTLYEVRRRDGFSGPFAFVGASGQRSFTDETLPAGVAAVVYQVTAVRSTTRGNPAQFIVNFGAAGAGQGATVTLTPQEAEFDAGLTDEPGQDPATRLAA